MNRYSNSNSDSKARKQFQKEYFGNYLGIVIQNNDPDKQGRVKVYIPHISPSIYESWYKEPVDKKFSFIGKNIDSDLTDIIDKLKDVVPWCECAAPLMGASGSGRYNAHTQTGFVSDSSKLSTTTTSTSTVFTKYGLNVDGTGEKPARIYETKELEVCDAFNATSISRTEVEESDTGVLGEPTASSVRVDAALGMPNKINKYSYQYKPTSYSNQVKGSFSIPNVGSHVWVFFKNGNPMSPVYFAVSFGTEDWNQIYNSSDGDSGPDYPGDYENVSEREDGTYSHNTETYRNKFVLNQKGGTLEIVNTDNREILKMTHYSGSFKEYNNEATIELLTGQDQKLVHGDQFLTVKGHKSELIEMDLDQIVRGDYYTKIGNFNLAKFEEWQEHTKVLSNIKQLFEIKRAEKDDEYNKDYPRISELQRKEPVGKKGHAACPVCSHSARPKFWDVNNPGVSLRLPSISTLATAAVGVAAGFILPLSLPTPFSYKQPPISPGNFLGSGKCPCCGGDGKSPSTFGGEFASQDKDSLVLRELKGQIAKLTKIEKDLGLGGSHIVNITKHKVENIGLVMNDFPSIRIDKLGKLVPSEVMVLKEGVVLNQVAVPLIEYVHVDAMPGGSYTLNCANEFNVHAGARGISFKSYGPVDIGGSIINVAGEQINISSKNEVNIDAGRVSIIADILSMRQRNYKQVVIESNLGVAGNAVVRGSLHVEGELTCQHITVPMEMKETDANTAYGQMNPVQIGTCIIGGGSSVGPHPVYGFNANPMAINTYEHSHVYESLPVTAVKGSNDVRAMGMSTSARIETSPQPVQHGGFLTKLTDKLGEVVQGAVGDFEI